MSVDTLHQTTSFGKSMYDKMRANFDYSQIIWTIRRYNKDISEERAEHLLDAFLQWVSLVPLNKEDVYVAMFQSPVEEAFHCFVLNTRLYARFCEQFLGSFFHHDPLVEEEGPAVERIARYTVEQLEQHYFGGELHPELKEWRKQLDAGTYKVACVGPGGRCK